MNALCDQVVHVGSSEGLHDVLVGNSREAVVSFGRLLLRGLEQILVFLWRWLLLTLGSFLARYRCKFRFIWLTKVRKTHFLLVVDLMRKLARLDA